MRRIVIAAMSALAIVVAGSAVHPFDRGTRAAGTDSPEMDAETAALISRACASCHTERTVWPWYGYVAPVSWMLEKDVNQARARMNLSRWAEQEVLLSTIQQHLYQWTKVAKRRIQYRALPSPINTSAPQFRHPEREVS